MDELREGIAPRLAYLSSFSLHYARPTRPAGCSVVGGALRWSELRRVGDPETEGLALLGDRWTLPLLSRCLAGVTRLDQFQRRYGLSRSIVADRLKPFVDEGLVERCACGQGQHEYRLTHKGRALAALFEAIRGWAQDHVAGPPRGSLSRHSVALSLRLARRQCEFAQQWIEGEGQK